MKSNAYVLFVCAGLLLSGGAVLGGCSAWGLVRMSYYFWITDLGVELGSIVLFISGALLCLPSCWLSTLVPYQPKCFSLAATLMCLVSAAMLMLSLGMTSLTGLSRAIREPAHVNTSMLRAMSLEACDPAIRSSFVSIQTELRCCGVQSPSDWYKYQLTLPPACCGRTSNGKVYNARQQGRTRLVQDCNVPLYTSGCLRPALAELRGLSHCLSTLASVMIVILASTLFATGYSLADSVAEHDDKPQPSPMHVARFAPHAPGPFVSVTSPIIVPHPQQI